MLEMIVKFELYCKLSDFLGLCLRRQHVRVGTNRDGTGGPLEQLTGS